MDNIVQKTMGLFGPSPAELERERQLSIAKQYQSYGAQGGKPGLGGVLGTAIGQGLATLFGGGNSEIQKLKDMNSYFNQLADKETLNSPYLTMSLAADVADKFGESEKAQNLRLKAAENKMDYDKNKSIIDHYTASTEKIQADADKAKNDYLGLVAYGANEALQNTEDPEKRQKIWDNTIGTFEKKGLDVSMYKDLPSSEWEKMLDQVATQSTSVIDLKKLQITQLKEERAANSLAETTRHNKQMEFLANKRIEITDEISRRSEAGKDTRAKEKELSDVEKLLNKTTLDSAWTSNKSEINNLGNKLISRELRSELKAYTQLEGENLTTGFADFKANYSKYLNQANDKGFPLYTMEEAKALALKDVKGKISTEGVFFKDKVYTPGEAPAVKEPKKELTKPVIKKEDLVVGKTYYDKNGYGAVYKGNNQWEPLKP